MWNIGGKNWNELKISGRKVGLKILFGKWMKKKIGIEEKIQIWKIGLKNFSQKRKNMVMWKIKFCCGKLVKKIIFQKIRVKYFKQENH